MGEHISWVPVSRGDLLTRLGDDPVLRWCTGLGELRALRSEHGWAWVHPWRPTGHWGGGAVVASGAPAQAESDALAELVARLPHEVELEWFSTAPGRDLTVPVGYRITGVGDWTFCWTEVAPPPPEHGTEPCWVALDDTADAAEIELFGRTHNPAFEGFPGLGIGHLWLGVRDGDGALQAVGSLQRLATGVPHLGGLVVHTELRGQGIGRVCTLGVSSETEAALRLYDAVGYGRARRFLTRGLEPQP